MLLCGEEEKRKGALKERLLPRFFFVSPDPLYYNNFVPNT